MTAVYLAVLCSGLLKLDTQSSSNRLIGAFRASVDASIRPADHCNSLLLKGWARYFDAPGP